MMMMMMMMMFVCFLLVNASSRHTRFPSLYTFYRCGWHERQSQDLCQLDCCWCHRGVVAVAAAVCAALMWRQRQRRIGYSYRSWQRKLTMEKTIHPTPDSPNFMAASSHYRKREEEEEEMKEKNFIDTTKQHLRIFGISVFLLATDTWLRCKKHEQ